MASFAIKSDELVLPSGIDGFGYLVIEDGVFGGVSVQRPEGMPIVDRMGCWVAPGFVDTHIHGFAGCDVMDCDPSAIDTITIELAKRGTTSWLATTLTASAQRTAEACASVAKAVMAQREDSGFVGARTHGIFLEGPFFTEGHKGAQDPRYLADPSIDLLNDWQSQAQGLIQKTALAPERDGAVDYIAQATAQGVVAAIGHSSATYGQAAAAVLAGASVVVHTFNGMDDLGHRDPGIVGCAMTSQGVYAELICDGKHVDPVACEALVRSKGWEHVVLITDCLSCGGLPDGSYFIGELPIELRAGAAYLKHGGNLAGSTLTLAQAVRNVVDWGIVTAEQAIRMASEVPARANGMADRCGSILPGRDADLVVLDRGLNLVETYVGGVRVEA
ncbi:MAG: N-acetylglucosamine-6-phosphate deacetylase [Coriobacteriales bacterium]|nr:N-acetylglucosamine-6-phosphate deacetylase [Coriobacteriales bacterium]